MVAYRDSRTSLSFAQQLAELYPQRVESWNVLRFYEELALGSAGAEALTDEHRERLRQFHTALSRAANPDIDDLVAMYWYGVGLKDTVIHRHWQTRLEREYPRHPQAVQLRVAFGIAKQHRGDPAGGLAAAESLWREVGPAHPMLLHYGLDQAELSRDPAAVLRWADRYIAFAPASSRVIASRMSRIPELREKAVEMLHVDMNRLDEAAETERGLFTTRPERTKEVIAAKRRILAALGNARIARGDLRGGLDTLELAIQGSWDRFLLRDAAAARLVFGDTTTALEYLAKIVADPATDSALADTARVLAHSHIGRHRWQKLVSNARTALRKHVLGESTMRPLGSVRLLDETGKESQLADIVGGSVSLIVLSSRFCGPAVAALPEVIALAKSAEQAGIKPVLLVDEKPSAEAIAWLRGRGVDLPVYFDSWRDAFRTIGSGGTPEYYVIDAAGVIRFANYGTVSDIRRQFMALLDNP